MPTCEAALFLGPRFVHDTEADRSVVGSLGKGTCPLFWQSLPWLHPRADASS